MNLNKFSILKKYLFGFLVFVLSFTLLLIITSCIFAYTSIEDRFLNIATYVIVIISSIVSSFSLAKVTKNRGMIHGLLLNIVSMALLYIIFSLLNGRYSVNNSLLFYLLVSVICGVLGGVLGVNM